MQVDIHPKYEQVQVACSCGNKFETGSSTCRNIHIEVCSECHPYYTGKQKLMDTEGRVDTFNKRFKNFAGFAKKKPE